MVDSPFLHKLEKFDTAGGEVLRAVRASDKGFDGFEEAYFSSIKFRVVRGWKRHNKMTLNLVVPLGKIRFAVATQTHGYVKPIINEYVLSREEYSRLTVPPGNWLAFQGLSEGESLLLNVANKVHCKNEADVADIAKFSFKWHK